MSQTVRKKFKYRHGAEVVTETLNALSLTLEKREHVWHDEDWEEDDE